MQQIAKDVSKVLSGDKIHVTNEFLVRMIYTYIHYTSITKALSRYCFVKVTQTAFAVGFLAVVSSSLMIGLSHDGDSAPPHFTLCFHNQNGPHVTKTEGFLKVVFFSA